MLKATPKPTTRCHDPTRAALTPTPNPQSIGRAPPPVMACCVHILDGLVGHGYGKAADPAGKMMRVAGWRAATGWRHLGLKSGLSLTWGDLSKSGRKNADDPMPPGFETHRRSGHQALGDLSKALEGRERRLVGHDQAWRMRLKSNATSRPVNWRARA